MESSRPLLGGYSCEDEDTLLLAQHARAAHGAYAVRDDTRAVPDGSPLWDWQCVRALSSCARCIDPARARSGSDNDRDAHAQRERLLSNGTTSSTCSDDSKHGAMALAARLRSPSSWTRGGCSCAVWQCLPMRLFRKQVADYADFATMEVIGEIGVIRQKTREAFDKYQEDDADMLRQLWGALFPTLPYDGRKDPRWREVGFQNDDPASDFRASGRFGLQMLLFFADHMNDMFRRMVRANRFPVCIGALNVIEMLLLHLKLKDPSPLCPCCGMDIGNLDRRRDRPELVGFVSLMEDCAWRASAQATREWPVEVAFAQIFMHTMLVLDRTWQLQLQRDPATNLLHFREALHATNRAVMTFLGRDGDPIGLVELRLWSARHCTENVTPLPMNDPSSLHRDFMPSYCPY